MKTQLAVSLGVAAGFGLGAITVHGLHAQAKPPVYYVAEIEVTNPDAYAKEYAPKAQAIIKAAGGKFLAIGGTAGGAKLTAFDGDAPLKGIRIISEDHCFSNPAQFGTHFLQQIISQTETMASSGPGNRFNT